MTEIVLIAAVAKNGVIGGDNRLLWHVPEDLAHFKQLTQGHAVLMGRKTWDSLPPRFRPLPGRRNLVLTRQKDWQAAGAETVTTVEAALNQVADLPTLFVIGGAEIYTQTLPLAQRLELTEVDLAPEGDAFFPPVSASEWFRETETSRISSTGVPVTFVSYRRRVQQINFSAGVSKG